jgi:hypothetical protein
MVIQINWRDIQRERMMVKGSRRMREQRAGERMLHCELLEEGAGRVSISVNERG